MPPPPPRQTPRSTRLVALFGLLVTGLLSMPACLFACNAINPMARAFMTTFQVRNDSGEQVRIWPVGAGASGNLRRLPLYAGAGLAIPALRTGGFVLAAGASDAITYDWDDVNFTMIVVEASDGRRLALAVDQDDPKEGCCWRHRKELYAIPPLMQLRPATPAEEALLTERPFWPALAVLVAMPVLFVFFCRKVLQIYREDSRAIAAQEATARARARVRPPTISP